jgi:chromosomal replication initiator protein
MIHQPIACKHCGAPSRPIAMIAHIQATVAAFYGLHRSGMTSDRRDKPLARARQVAMYLARELTPRSMPEIGRRFGNRDHTTVLHGIRSVEKRMIEDAELRADVELLKSRLTQFATNHEGPRVAEKKPGLSTEL